MPKHHKDLTVARIVSKAIELADVTGVATLSMRSLAKELGVTPMSLYRHVANKEDLLGKMVDAVFAKIELPVIGNDWRTEMHKRAVSMRANLLSHRWAVGLLDSSTQSAPAKERHHNAVVGTLREGGFSLASITLAFTTLDAYIYGFVLQELSLPLGEESDFGEVENEVLEELDTIEFPYLTELAMETMANADFDFASLFETGLNIVIEGLALVNKK